MKNPVLARVFRNGSFMFLRFRIYSEIRTAAFLKMRMITPHSGNAVCLSLSEKQFSESLLQTGFASRR